MKILSTHTEVIGVYRVRYIDTAESYDVADGDRVTGICIPDAEGCAKALLQWRACFPVQFSSDEFPTIRRILGITTKDFSKVTGTPDAILKHWNHRRSDLMVPYERLLRIGILVHEGETSWIPRVLEIDFIKRASNFVFPAVEAKRERLTVDGNDTFLWAIQKPSILGDPKTAAEAMSVDPRVARLQAYFAQERAAGRMIFSFNDAEVSEILHVADSSAVSSVDSEDVPV